MNENGFHVNTDVKVKPQKRKRKKFNKGSKSIIAIGVLALAVLIVAFCLFIPVRSTQELDYCVIDYGNSVIETDYYENDRVVKKVATESGVETINTVYAYDNDGNILKEESFIGGTKISVVNYVYSDSKLTKKENCNPDNTVNSAIEYHYNPDGTVTMELIYDEKGNIVTQLNHTYENGVRVETSRVTLSNNLTETITYTYKNGNVETEKQISDAGEKTTNYTYDNSGKILTKKVLGSGIIVYRYNYKTVKRPIFS